MSQYRFNEADIVMLLCTCGLQKLTDLSSDSPSSSPRQIPTRQNMIDAMRWLVQGAQPNDSLFFHYVHFAVLHTALTVQSGHGGSTKDLDGDEDDGMDEVIYRARPH